MDCFINFHTDIGGGRVVNQDSYAVLTALSGGQRAAVLLVCDGMGGLSRGELASKEAACAFCQWFERGLPELLEDGFCAKRLFFDWGNIIERVNRQLMEFGRRNKLELGTTLTAVLFWNGSYYGVHVGDCRLYAIGRECRQLTRDQTLAAYRKAHGRTAGDTDHILMQCIGASPKVHPEFIRGTLKKDTVYLLCTDGFRRKINEKELKTVFSPGEIRGREELGAGLRELMSRAKKRGETDNMTAVTIKIC